MRAQTLNTKIMLGLALAIAGGLLATALIDHEESLLPPSDALSCTTERARSVPAEVPAEPEIRIEPIPAPVVEPAEVHAAPPERTPQDRALAGEFYPWILLPDGSLYMEKVVTLEYQDGRRVAKVARVTATPHAAPLPFLERSAEFPEGR